VLSPLVADVVVQLIVGSVLLVIGSGGAFLWRSWRKHRAIEAGPVPVAVTFEQDPKRIFTGPVDWVTLAVWLPEGAVPPEAPERSRDLYSATADLGANRMNADRDQVNRTLGDLRHQLRDLLDVATLLP